MSRYIVLYEAPTTVAERFAQATSEEASKGLKLWAAWADRIGSALVDMGKPLGNAMTVTETGVVKRDSNIIGMSILQANTMDEALEMVRDHHHLYWAENCEIVVLEEVPIPENE